MNRTLSALPLLLALATEARAALPAHCTNESNVATAAFILVPTGALVGVPGFVAAAGQIPAFVRHEQGGLGWRIFGFTAGGANVAAGATFLALGLATGDECHSADDIFAWAGLGQLALGLATIGLAAGSTILPEAQPEGVTWRIDPVLSPDRIGAALTIDF